ncbi:nitronate monooxygenase [Fructilactobacillus vespulae]|uniref:NAD(P)H-dependent flavin oxidoreductase n=1 Tax=Fructilactobacillus vespulae TaxID=1249630 RepID=UPI0039B3D221
MDNRVSKILKIKYPIIQASMNWLTDAKLVAAVSNAGGLGVLGPNAGRNSLAEDSATVVKNKINRAQKLTKKPFAYNLTLNGADSEQSYAHKLLEIALDAGVKIFIVSGSPHADLYQKIKANGAILIARSFEPTAQEAQLQEKLGADIIIATGYDEGGVIPTTGNGTFTTIPRIVDAVSIPVVAAGGINDLRGIRAAHALGAAGFYLGTRFIVTKESRAAASCKQLIIDAGVGYMVLVAPNQRSVRNAKMDELATEFQNGSKTTFAKTREMGGTKTAMLDGRLKDGEISVSTGIDLIRDCPSVADLINRLMVDYN